MTPARGAARAARPKPWGAVLLLLPALLASAGGAAAQAPGADRQCALCHGELELLRQHVPTPARARELLVAPATVRGSAHGELACTECHSGFGVFPHPERETATASCASCHEKADTAWRAGAHALLQSGGELAAGCASCHGVHDAEPASALEKGPAMARMNAGCTACHAPNALPAGDPHAGQVGCWSCHGPHEVHEVDDPASLMAPGRQSRTCGACHDTAAAAWRADAHGTAVREAVGKLPALSLSLADEAPLCTSCHGGHGMPDPETRAFAREELERCGACHEKAAETFTGTYHGKATALGSRVSAACSDCHGAHTILPASDPASAVAAGNLVETCGACHEHARPAFVEYDSHPDPFDRSRNPWIFYAFWAMNGLLVMVLGVFGVHTALWWVRLRIDRRSGEGHHPHEPERGE